MVHLLELWRWLASFTHSGRSAAEIYLLKTFLATLAVRRLLGQSPDMTARRLLTFSCLSSAHFAPPAIPLLLVVMVAAADIFGLSVITFSAQAFQAFERLRWTAT